MREQPHTDNLPTAPQMIGRDHIEVFTAGMIERIENQGTVQGPWRPKQHTYVYPEDAQTPPLKIAGEENVLATGQGPQPGQVVAEMRGGLKSVCLDRRTTEHSLQIANSNDIEWGE